MPPHAPPHHPAPAPTPPGPAAPLPPAAQLYAALLRVRPGHVAAVLAVARLALDAPPPRPPPHEAPAGGATGGAATMPGAAELFGAGLVLLRGHLTPAGPAAEAARGGDDDEAEAGRVGVVEEVLARVGPQWWRDRGHGGAGGAGAERRGRAGDAEAGAEADWGAAERWAADVVRRAVCAARPGSASRDGRDAGDAPRSTGAPRRARHARHVTCRTRGLWGVRRAP